MPVPSTWNGGTLARRLQGSWGLGLTGLLESPREEGSKTEMQTECWVWNWGNKSASSLLGALVSHQYPERVGKNGPFGSCQEPACAWAVLLPGVPHPPSPLPDLNAAHLQPLMSAPRDSRQG